MSQLQRFISERPICTLALFTIFSCLCGCAADSNPSSVSSSSDTAEKRARKLVDRADIRAPVSLDKYDAVRVEVTSEPNSKRPLTAEVEETMLVNGLQKGLSQGGTSLPVVGRSGQVSPSVRILTVRFTRIVYDEGSRTAEVALSFGISAPNVRVAADVFNADPSELAYRVEASSKGGTAFSGGTALSGNLSFAAEQVGMFIAVLSQTQQAK